MMICAHCGEPLTETRQCTRCGFTALHKSGVDSHVQGTMGGARGFKAEYFADLFSLESGNFWFKARNQLIVNTLRRHCGGLNSFLEIGCGTGFVLSGIMQQFPKAKIVGSEIFTAGLEFATERNPGASFLQMDARKMPYCEAFDVIGAFDVLEHIEEDVEVMRQANIALRSDGYFLITVPQHPWLWSQADSYAQHVRRYDKAELHKKLASTGFEIIRSTSFVSTLLPAMAASRLMNRRASEKPYDALAEFNIPAWLNNLLWRALSLEVSLVDFGLNLPIGGSRMVLAKKTQKLSRH
jgi:SAM-dependent methyltransferase